MATPTIDQGTQHEYFSPQKLLNEAISIITLNFTLSKFTNHTVLQYKNINIATYRLYNINK